MATFDRLGWQMAPLAALLLVGVLDGVNKLGFALTALLIVAVVGLRMLDNLPQAPTLLFDQWPLISVTMGICVGLLLPAFTSRTGSDEFYSATAQVIPVLLLAIGLELRALPKRPGRGDIYRAAMIMAVLAAGEWYSLWCLDRGHGSKNDFNFIVLAIATGITALILIAMSNLSQRSPGDDKDGPPAQGYL